MQNTKPRMTKMGYVERYLRYRTGLRNTTPTGHNLTPAQVAHYRERVDAALRAHRIQVIDEIAAKLRDLA